MKHLSATLTRRNNLVRGGDTPQAVHGKSFSNQSVRETNTEFAALKRKQGKK